MDQKRLDLREHHHGLETISRSQLVVFIKDRAEFESRYVLKNAHDEYDDGSKLSLIGDLVHALVLEVPQLGEQIIAQRYLLPKYQLSRRQGRLWRLHCDRAEQMRKVPILWSDLMIATRAAYELYQDPTLRTWFTANGIREQRFEVEHESGLKIAMQEDLVVPLPEQVLCIDLKAMEDPSRFRSSAQQFRYDIQDVFYSYILEKHFERDVKFRYVVCHTKSPYKARIIRHDLATINRAMTEFHESLHELAECLKTGEFGQPKLETEVVRY